ncbi:protein kinase domain-containing protein [Oceanithermus sp.]
MEVLAGRYRLIEPIGSGGMAEVWRARDERVGREVAVKLLYEHVHPVERQRFAQEVRALAALSHPGVVAIYDLGEEAGRTFFVMELVKGGTFDRLGPFEAGVEGLAALEAALEVLSALEHLHGRGILHRDLTPKNILLTEEGRPKLMDFGLAYLSDATRHFTRTGYTLGTPQYMAPEQAKGGALTPAADLYSFGAVLYRTLTGRPPFEGEHDQAVLYQHVYEPPPDPVMLNPALPEELAAWLLRMLAKDPAGRPASAAQARRELAAILGAVRDSLTATARAGAARSGHYPAGPVRPELLELQNRAAFEGEAVWPVEPVADAGLLALGAGAALHLFRLPGLQPLTPFAAGDEVTAAAALCRGRVYYADWEGVLRSRGLGGARHFEFKSRAEVTASPLVTARRVYLAGRDGYLYALDHQGELEWAFEAGGHISAGPTLYRNLLFAASESGWLFALDPVSGKLVYKVETGPIHAHVPAGGGLLILPTWAGEVHAFDPLTREVRWTYDVEGELWGSPAVGGGRVYVAGWSGVLYALELENGDEAWTARVGRVTAGLSLAGGVLYVASEAGELIAFDAASGAELWRAEGLGGVQAAPLPLAGRLYAASLEGSLYEFAESGPAQANLSSRSKKSSSSP